MCNTFYVDVVRQMLVSNPSHEHGNFLFLSGVLGVVRLTTEGLGLHGPGMKAAVNLDYLVVDKGAWLILAECINAFDFGNTNRKLFHT